VCVSVYAWMFLCVCVCVTRMNQQQDDERWGAGVETHFQEISWNLRPVVNGT